MREYISKVDELQTLSSCLYNKSMFAETTLGIKGLTQGSRRDGTGTIIPARMDLFREGKNRSNSHNSTLQPLAYRRNLWVSAASILA
jgi:hypothetical protein